MATTIVTKNGSGAPTASDLVAGELAVDLTNKRLYTEDSGGTVLELGTNPASNVTFGDNTKAIFGAGSDLQIYHDGSHSYIKDTATGNLRLDGTDIQIRSAAGANMAAFVSGAEVQLYHNNQKKLDTTATGIDVTGTVTADVLTVVNSTDTQGRFSGWSVIGANSSSGAIELGQDSAYQGIMSYAAEGSTRFLFDNTYGSTGSTFEFRTNTAATAKTHLKIGGSGDISFYEDTGTTPKFFWDASAESLGIGTSSIDLTSSGRTVVQIEGSSNALLNLTDGTSRLYLHQKGGTSGADIWNSANSYMRFATNDTEAMRIDASGNIGIGETSIGSNALEIRRSGASGIALKETGVAQLIVEQDTDAKIRVTNSKNLIFSGGTDGITERMRIANTGQLLVGSGQNPASGEVKQTLARAGSSYLEFQNTSANTGSTIGTSGENFIVYTNSGALGSEAYTERMRIDAAGNVGIGDNNPLSILHIGGGSDANVPVTFAPSTGGNAEFRNTSLTGTFTFTNNNGSSEAMRIDSSGNLLVGLSSGQDALIHAQAPKATYTDYGTVFAGGTDSDNGQHAISLMSAGDSLAGIIGSNLSIDGTSFSQPNTGRSSGYISFTNSTTAGKTSTITFGGLTKGTTTALPKMTLDGDGNLFVGTTTGSFGARITAESSTSYLFESRRTGTGSEGHVVFRNANGAVGTIFTDGTATSYNTSSDQRLKDNIVDAPSASDDIDSIQVRSFDWKADGSHQKYGMVAQELQVVAPEAVSGDPDSDEMMGVDYSKLVPMMLKEIQSLRARVAQLES